MNEPLKIGDLEIYWLNGGEFALDGGTMFGSVPKIIWSKKYQADAENYIKLLNSPLLVKSPTALTIIESGIGNKLSDKQKKIFRVSREWSLPADLQALGIDRQDIDFLVLTHCDFDHAGGIVMHNRDGEPELTFPNARHVIQQKEWEDAIKPNRRAAHTYWPQNLSLLQDSDKLMLVDGDHEFSAGLTVMHTNGHTRGHQIVKMESQGQMAVHLADLLPTHIHFNPLWIMSYDNFPLEVVAKKEELLHEYIGRSAWFTFYHDPFVRACRFAQEGNLLDSIPV